MNHCFYRKNPNKCRYYPRCSENCIRLYTLNQGQNLAISSFGPHIIYLHSGYCLIDCNGFRTEAGAPGFFLVPDFEFTIHTLSRGRVYIFGPELVRMLADKLSVDYYRTRLGARTQQGPLKLVWDNTAISLSQSIITEYLACRRYVELKLEELIFILCPGNHNRIAHNLASKYWFFRIRFMDLLKTCSSLEEFAFAMGLSESGFSKAFKKAFNRSFYNWYLDWKLESITDDMIRSELSLKEIAGKYGFYSVQHLHTFIRKKTGLPPGKFRAKLLSERRI